jgi:hypothetical protein
LSFCIQHLICDFCFNASMLVIHSQFTDKIMYVDMHYNSRITMHYNSLSLSHTHSHTHAHTHSHTYTHTHTQMHTNIHRYTHTNIRKYTHTRIHTYMHTLTHANTHPHTHLIPHPLPHTQATTTPRKKNYSLVLLPLPVLLRSLNPPPNFLSHKCPHTHTYISK